MVDEKEEPKEETIEEETPVMPVAEKPVETEDDLLVRLYPDEGSWQDLTNSCSEEDTLPIVWDEKRYTVTYKWIGWGAMNQITEKIAKKLGTDPSPIVYERKKQEMMLKRIVTKIGDTPMQDGNGNPIEANWIQIPAQVGEQLRTSFFQNTGEVMQRFGLDEEKVLMLKSVIDGLLDEEGNVLKDGPIGQEENALKKS